MNILTISTAAIAVAVLTSAAAIAQPRPATRSTAQLDRPAGQELNRPPTGFRAEHARRARRQAQFNQHYPGTPLIPVIRLTRPDGEVRSNGAF